MTNRCTDEELGRLITFYELNQLSEPDYDRFEKHLMECQYCYQELREMRPLVTTLRTDKAQILQKLAGEGVRLADEKQAWLNASRRQPAPRNVELFIGKLKGWWEDLTRPVVWVPAAAAVVVLLILVLPTFRSQNPYLPYLDYSQAPYTGVSFRSPAGLSEEARRLFKAGITEYSQEHFRKAAGHLEKAVELAPEESQIWLYLGISRYLDHSLKPAITALTRALTTEDEVEKDLARWYLSQAYLLKGDADQALPLLQETARQGGTYAPRANSLLTKIKTIQK